MKVRRTDKWLWLAFILNVVCSFVFAGNPEEMLIIRQGYEAKIGQMRQEATARERPVHEAYLRDLDRCLKRLELEGRVEDAASVRAERARVLGAVGGFPASVAETAIVGKAAQAESPMPVIKARIRGQEELLAQAKVRLNALQYAVAEKLTFKDFKCEASKGASFCEVSCVMTADDDLFQYADLKAQVRFLMDAGKHPLVFDSGEVGLEPAANKDSVFEGFRKGKRCVFYRREGGVIPLSARITVLYFEVPIYEALWTKNGNPSRYNREGGLPWWQDKRGGKLVNVNTATEEELMKKLGIKGHMARSFVENRPFIDIKEIEKKVSGVGPETYKQLEKNIGVR